MDLLSIVCIALGILVIVRRGPLMFAPRPTLLFYEKLVLSTNARFRVMSVIFLILATGFLFSDLGDGILNRLLDFLGWFMAAVAVLFLMLPNAFRRIVRTAFGYVNKADEWVLRSVGFVGVVGGLALIYVGLYVV